MVLKQIGNDNSKGTYLQLINGEIKEVKKVNPTHQYYSASGNNDPEKRLLVILSMKDAVQPDPGYKAPSGEARCALDTSLWTRCDLCGLAENGEKQWWIWATVDMLPRWPGVEQFLIMCDNCDTVEMTNANRILIDEANGKTTTSYASGNGTAAVSQFTLGWEQKAIEELKKAGKLPPMEGEPNKTVPGIGWYDSGGKFRPYSTVTTSTYKSKCTLGHFTEIKPEDLGIAKSYGYLRLASERGGITIDTDADYIFGLSTNWGKVEPNKTPIINFSGKPHDIPEFEEVDDPSNWPPIVVNDWPDMKAPPPVMQKYIAWAAKQWRAGKNIQFGCYGGHGRTGTMAAGLLLIEGIVKTETEAIDKVRELHCIEAVESTSQKDWLTVLAVTLYGTDEEKAYLEEWAKNGMKTDPRKKKA